MKLSRILLLLILVLASLVVLGGSGYRYLFGAHSLDVVGEASRHDGELTLPGSGWANYGNDSGGHRYSSADQIDTTNVSELEVAWLYSTGDLSNKPVAIRESIAEATPILVDDALVFCTPFNEVIALDPGSGEELWRFDARIDLDQRHALVSESKGRLCST